MRLLSTGIVTSPDYPDNYPYNLKQTQAIQVKQGQILSLEFTSFDIEYDSNCTYDHLTIMDGDGTTLMEKSCGSDGNLVIGGPESTWVQPTAQDQEQEQQSQFCVRHR